MGRSAGVLCDASLIVAERAAFWRPLAEDQERPMVVEVAPTPVLVGVSGEDLAACTDVLLENVFSHTAEGEAFGIRLSRRAGGGAWLVVADDGPGFPGTDPTERGLSSGGLAPLAPRPRSSYSPPPPCRSEPARSGRLTVAPLSPRTTSAGPRNSHKGI